ncbi:MAG: DUF3786 domain-containing protein [Pseudomonadota bacterium]
MPRIDDYKQALELGQKDLEGKSYDILASLSGAAVIRDGTGKTSLSLPFLNREVIISLEPFQISYKDSHEELPIQQQILLLHYLHGAFHSNGSAIKGEWIAFQDIPDGKFYLDAFHRRAKLPMVQTFGERSELFVQLAAEIFGADPLDQGDISVVIRAFPLVPVSFIIWRGDEDFPPEGNILFDRNISDILSAEDVSWLSGMIVYPLIGMAKAKG